MSTTARSGMMGKQLQSYRARLSMVVRASRVSLGRGRREEGGGGGRGEKGKAGRHQEESSKEEKSPRYDITSVLTSEHATLLTERKVK